MIEKAIVALKQATVLPQESRDSIYEQFDPVLITNEIIERELPRCVDAVLDYEGDDAGFIAMLRRESASVIVKVVAEIEEGFIEGINDVLLFLKANFINLLMVSAPPQQANMAKGILVPNLLKFVENCWNEGQKKQDVGNPPPKPTPTATPTAAPATTEPKVEAA